ncbi:MAG TPA: DUF29 domain-containing protein [Caulobacterales bacterium]|jgi:hypothetical protein|nr:DUF29 domain-containing protein [Caulobacterales bacterium]
MAADDLYDRDFYLWTKAQAEALRARGRGGNAIDYDVLAEEVEDLGKRDLRECISRTLVIIEHLMKLAWSTRAEPRGVWRATIRVQRTDLKRALTPSLRRMVEDELDAIHADAAQIAADSFGTEEPAGERDVGLRWTLRQILGEENDPLE